MTDINLTARQQQIAALLIQGMSNKEIARVLLVAEGTIKNHLHVLYERLNVTSRAKLVVKLQHRADAGVAK